ncbi:MAG: AEC family transporter [Acinetobacter sp.]
MIVNIILPIVMIMFMGYSSIKLNLISSEHIRALATFVIKIALPAYILHSLGNKQLSDIWQPVYMLAYGGGSILVFFIAFQVFRRLFGHRLTPAVVMSMGASMSNTGLIGSAILPLLMGSHAIVYLSLTIIFESLILVTVVLFLAEAGLQSQAKPKDLMVKTFKNLLKNPLVIAIVMAMICMTFDIRLPHIFDQALENIGKSASPLALFVIGGSLVGLGIKALDLQVVLLVISKVVLMPFTIFILFYLLPNVTKPMMQAGTLIAALPMPTLFGILGQIYGLEKHALTALMLSTVFGFIGIGCLIVLWW